MTAAAALAACALAAVPAAPGPVFPGPAADGVVADGEATHAVEILSARRVGNVAVADYDFRDFLDDEALERIASGSPWSFKHRVEVVAPRRWMLVRRKVLAAALIETSVEFDPLTRRYALERRVRLKGLADEGIGSRKIAKETGSLPEALSWLSAFRGIEVYHPAVAFPDEPLTLRVEASFGRRFVAWLIPVSISAAAEAPLATDS